jgi:hypothetical protein
VPTHLQSLDGRLSAVIEASKAQEEIVTAKPDTPLLDEVRFPADLRKLPESDLPQLAAELRTELIDAVAATGGHLGAGLGVVELTSLCITCSTRRTTASSGTSATRPIRTRS